MLTVGLVEKVDAVGTGPLAERALHSRPARGAALRRPPPRLRQGRRCRRRYLRQGQEALRRPDDRRSASASPTSCKSLEAEHLRPRSSRPLESGRTRADSSRRSTRSTRAETGRGGARPAGGDGGQRADGRRGGELPRRHGPADSAASRPSTRPRQFPVRRGPRALPDAERGRGALDPQGQPVRRGAAARSRATSPTPTSSCRRSPGRASSRRIPEIAWAHHEKLDGSGYPRRLTRRRSRVQSRMMTIADIFDALVAWDRPYKSRSPWRGRSTSWTRRRRPGSSTASSSGSSSRRRSSSCRDFRSAAAGAKA